MPERADHYRRSDIIRLRISYALSAILIFLSEIVIAAFVHDALIRPYLGDSLAVALVYCTVRAIASLGVRWSVATALAAACAIEFGQLFHLANLLGLGHCRIARVVLGTGFDPADFLAYAGGAAAILLTEAVRARRARS